MNIFYSPYDVLGVKPGDSIETVKRRYKDLIRQFSPEKHPGKFSEIREAYEYINNGTMTRKDAFPVYKSLLTWLAEKEETERRNAIPPREPLSKVFETPYSTLVELRNLMKKHHQNW